MEHCRAKFFAGKEEDGNSAKESFASTVLNNYINAVSAIATETIHQR